MNRLQLASLITALAGTVVGGVAVVQSLTGGTPMSLSCAPDGDCVLGARPVADQCAVLLEGGGDRPGEMSGLEGDGAQAARVLYALQEGGAINGFRTLPDGDGCIVAIALSRQQADAWRDVVLAPDASTLGEAAAILQPAPAAQLAVQWGGGPTPEERTETFELSATDAGVP